MYASGSTASGRIGLGGLAEQHQRPDQFTLLLPEHASQHVAERIVRIQRKGLVERLLGVFQSVVQRQQLRPPAPRLRVVRVLADDALDGQQSRFVLAVVVLLKGLVDLGMNILAAPLELLAAAAGTGCVRVDGHGDLPSRQERGGLLLVRIRTRRRGKTVVPSLTGRESDLCLRQSERRSAAWQRPNPALVLCVPTAPSPPGRLVRRRRSRQSAVRARVPNEKEARVW